MATTTKTFEREHNGTKTLSPAEVTRLFENGYREVEVLPDGRVREASSNGRSSDDTVTRTLKTQRTWY